MKIKDINLPKGGTLNIEYTPKFLDAVRYAFDKSDDEEVSDDDIRAFIYSTFSNALEKEAAK